MIKSDKSQDFYIDCRLKRRFFYKRPSLTFVSNYTTPIGVNRLFYNKRCKLFK